MPPSAHRFVLPAPPADQQRLLDAGGVACWAQGVDIPTYEPGEPDPFPMFFDRRVYQGSDGGVYPLPFTDRIATRATPHRWRAIHLENRWVRLMLLPEIGGRIHVGFDKTRGYDFFYRNTVIKPALVGLAGPWVSGGVEFNWPQHHRPGTYLPVETSVERHDDGAVTVWHSDLDPLQRMRETHGVRLRPDESTVEVAVRLFNRTDERETFLWWANVAAAVHEDYQSFFPVDVRFVADHARRAVTAFPAADRPYYGVDYPALAAVRPSADRLDRYTNIPVPTSYMVTDTADEFFGGYDHRARAGFVHWADHDIAPGKKQWTWGNGPIGHAWDRQLTDADGPYVELMAGVFTDNQPDFSYLAPGETREFSQFWYPIQEVGPVQAATREAALSIAVADGRARIGVASSRLVDGVLVLEHDGSHVRSVPVTAAPGAPHLVELDVPGCDGRDDLVVRLVERERDVVAWRAHPASAGEPWLATEPPPPAEVTSVDEALLTAQHLRQYRHPTRSPLPYLERALQIDPGDSRTHLALAEVAHRGGRYDEALDHLATARARITRRNLNPRDGELHHRLGLTLERLGRFREATAAFAKSTWDGAYALAGNLGVTRTSLRLHDDEAALEHAGRAVEADPRNATAQALRVVALARAGRTVEASAARATARAADPLDPLLAALDGALTAIDPGTYLIVAHELARLGEDEAALSWAGRAAAAGPSVFGNPAPVAHYVRAMLLERAGDAAGAVRARHAAATVDRSLAFPAGLDDLDALRAAVSSARAVGSQDAVALGLLGTWYLGARQGDAARATLEEAVAAGTSDPVALRNAAIAVANTTGDLDRADRHLAAALAAGGPMARLVFERDQLARLRGVAAAQRLAAVEASGADLMARDDLTIAYVGLLLDVGRCEEAMGILTTRVFQPFEGGEGQVIAAFDRARLAVAAGLAGTDPAAAAALLDAGMVPPDNLGEGRHPADPMAAVLVACGDAHAAAGHDEVARARWLAARDAGGALAVAPRPAREDDEWVGVAHVRLGELDRAARVWDRLERTADELEAAPPVPDYFATSLPELLLFTVDDAAGRRRRVTALRQAAARGRALTTQAAER